MRDEPFLQKHDGGLKREASYRTNEEGIKVWQHRGSNVPISREYKLKYWQLLKPSMDDTIGRDG